MNTKFIKHITTAAALTATVCFSSCKKDFLDYESPSKLSIKQTFESVENTNSVIIGAYTKLAGDPGYGRQLSIYYSLGGDDFTYRGALNFETFRDYVVANYAQIPANETLFRVFTNLYQGIERANVACKYIPLSNLYNNGTAEQKAKMRMYYGEALTLRALYYSELIRNWGDVPASFVPAADLPTQFVPNTNRDETYDRILDDLGQAASWVPWRNEIPSYGTFRLTKAAVKALRARIALARGGYSLRLDKMERPADYQKYYRIAFDECNDIIKSNQHSLNPVYENIFKSLHGTTRYDNTNELIFEVAMWGQQNDSYLGSSHGLRFNNSPSWGGAGGTVTALPTYFYEFEAGKDVRRDVTLALYNVEASGATDVKVGQSSINMTLNKFRKSWTAFTGAVTGTYGVNWPIVRYADVLLMYAEAANELQDFTGSITPAAALQLVQKRAYGLNEIPVTPTSRDEFFNAIVKERLLEFGGEGMRKYDLIRWNMLAGKIAEVRENMKQFAVNAPGKYQNMPQYLYFKASSFNNLSGPVEMATLDVYVPANTPDQPGGKINYAAFNPSLTSAPAGYTQKWWRNEMGSYNATTGVYTLREYVGGFNNSYAAKFEANKKELLPYPQKVLDENRGAVVQNYGY